MWKRSDLRPAQVSLVSNLKSYNDGICVVGMGGGKTAAMLTAIQDMIEGDLIDNAVVLAPARVVDNVWPAEPGKWEHLYLDVVPVTGPPMARERKLWGEGDVHVVSIDNTKWLVDQLKDGDVSRTLLVIDEISKFKNPASKRGAQLLKISQKFNGVWGMTGTPRPNGLIDLFLPLKLVGGKDVWGIRSFYRWRDEYFRATDYHGYNWEVRDYFKSRLEQIAAEFLVKHDVFDLVKPDLLTGDDFIREVTMTDEQRTHYETMMNDLYARADGDEAWIVQAMSQGVASGKLTQIVQGFLYQEDGSSEAFKHNPKLALLQEMDEELGGDAAVICYGLREEVTQLEDALRHRRVARLGGGVKPEAAKQIISDFRYGKIDRLLLHPASAGHGVDGLQEGGHHMIWYHPTWSPEMYDQTVKRLDRPGQKHDVRNWHILMKDTLDYVKYARVEHKMADQEAFKAMLKDG